MACYIHALPPLESIPHKRQEERLFFEDRVLCPALPQIESPQLLPLTYHSDMFSGHVQVQVCLRKG